MRKFFVSAFFILIFFLSSSRVEAVGSISLSTNKATVNVGDTFTVSVNLSGTSIATLTARLSIDTQKIQYVSGPSNSNYSNGRVIYTWTDPTGGDSPLTGGTIATFTFSAKSAGNASFGISGDFFTPDEISANPTFSGTTVSVKTLENENTGSQGGGSTGNQSSGDTGNQSGGNTGNQSGGDTGNQSGGNTGSQSGGDTGNQSGGNTGNQSGGNTGSQSGGNTGNQSGGNTGNQSGGNTGSQGGGNTGNQSGGNTGSQSGGNTGNQSGGNTGSQGGGNTGNQSGGNTGSQSGENTGSRSGGNTGNQNGGNIGNQNSLNQNEEIALAPSDVQINGNNFQESNVELGSNTNLKILQLNVEGISPSFNSENTQYYITISEDIQNIEVIAEPENSKSTIQIEGNTNIQSGTSKINITVTAEDGTVKVYTINVNKTSNFELANTNLENLAIENITLNPEFNPEIINYITEVYGDIDQLNILAVPQNEKAKVLIEGNENLKYGDNLIKVTVIAEDGVSSKIYNIKVTKNEEIDLNKNEEEKNQKENENGINNIVNDSMEKNVKKERNIIVFLIIAILIFIVVIYLWKKKKKITNDTK